VLSCFSLFLHLYFCCLYYESKYYTDMLWHEYSIFVLSSLKILKGGIALYVLHMHTQITLLKILPFLLFNWHEQFIQRVYKYCPMFWSQTGITKKKMEYTDVSLIGRWYYICTHKLLYLKYYHFCYLIDSVKTNTQYTYNNNI
jgi:hypothetical protein